MSPKVNPRSSQVSFPTQGADMAASTVSSWVPPSLPESGAAPGLVLLDMHCYMAMPVGSSREGWHCDCVVDVKDVDLEAGDPCLSDLMVMLGSKTAQTWKELPVAYPILSMDDDVVYLLSRTRPRHIGKLAVMFAIDVRKATLRGLAELDVQRSSILLPNFCTSEICRST